MREDYSQGACLCDVRPFGWLLEADQVSCDAVVLHRRVGRLEVCNDRLCPVGQPRRLAAGYSSAVG